MKKYSFKGGFTSASELSRKLACMKSERTRSKTKGFTLIEIMTALSIFLIVMTISMGSILGIFDASRKSQSIKAVMNNLNLALESMSREMRFGSTYHCGTSGVLTESQNCPSGESFISFFSSEGEQVVYRLNNNSIEKWTETDSSYNSVTAPEVVVTNLTFYVLGTGLAPSNTLQPSVLISIKGYSGTDAGSRTDFTLQTLVSQRALDL